MLNLYPDPAHQAPHSLTGARYQYAEPAGAWGCPSLLLSWLSHNFPHPRSPCQSSQNQKVLKSLLKEQELEKDEMKLSLCPRTTRLAHISHGKHFEGSCLWTHKANFSPWAFKAPSSDMFRRTHRLARGTALCGQEVAPQCGLVTA